MRPLEQKMLALFQSHPGEVLTHEAILNHIYQGLDEPRLPIIKVVVSRLRKSGATIETVFGRGYKYNV